MSFDKQKVIDIALAEVGYLEKASKANLDDKTANAGSNNITKYARDLAAIGYFNGNKQGVAWCAVWLCWCFVQAFGKAAALKLLCQPTRAANNAGAGCKHARNYFKAKGRLHDSPQVGDQIFFYSVGMNDISHTGLVYKVDEKKVYTVEGNTSSASGVVANGGAVAKKSYSLTYSRIAGYGRPDYGAQVEETPEKAPEKPAAVDLSGFETYTVKKGDTLWRIAQKTMGAGSKYKAIMTLNSLSSEKLKVGQVLKIREKAKDSTAAEKPPAYTEYTVKKGDSLWRIAAKHLGSGNRYKEIMTASGMSSDKLKIGQKLKIPKA
jgi:LysM repeat protein